jgi:hypothetical protein
MKKIDVLSLIKYSVIGLFLLIIGCTENSQADRLSRYLSSINAQEVSSVTAAAPAAGAAAPAPPYGLANAGTVGSANAIVAGTPRTVTRDGFCGDGVINGTTEDCDQGAIQNTTCREYGGISGVVSCQPNCLYDISDCITPAVDKKIGGAAENCKCNCTSTVCRGGCQSTTLVGQSTCRYTCDNDCTCRCESMLEAYVNDCEFRCACSIDVSGNPNCECSLDDCELLVAISPNVATIAGGPGIGIGIGVSKK